MSKYSKPSYHEETIRKKDLQIRKLHEELRKRDRPSAHPSTDRSAAPPPTKIQKRLGSRFVHAKIRENEKIADYAFRAIENTELFTELDEVIDDLGRQFEKDFKKIMTPHPFHDAIRGPTLPMSKGAFMACKNFNITKGCPHVLSEEIIFHTINNDPTRIVGHLCMYCLKFLNLVKIHPAWKCEALKALDNIKDTQTSRKDPKDVPKVAPNDNDDTDRSFVKELISKLDFVDNSVKNLEKKFNHCLDNQNRSRSKFKEYKKVPAPDHPADPLNQIQVLPKMKENPFQPNSLIVPAVAQDPAPDLPDPTPDPPDPAPPDRAPGLVPVLKNPQKNPKKSKPQVALTPKIPTPDPTLDPALDPPDPTPDPPDHAPPDRTPGPVPVLKNPKKNEPQVAPTPKIPR